MKLVSSIVLLAILCTCVAWCIRKSDERAEDNRGEFLIEMIDCNGSVTRSWVSINMPQYGSGGVCYFTDKSGLSIKVVGDIVITKQN